jgi:hypothetical protein
MFLRSRFAGLCKLICVWDENRIESKELVSMQTYKKLRIRRIPKELIHRWLCWRRRMNRAKRVSYLESFTVPHVVMPLELSESMRSLLEIFVALG